MLFSIWREFKSEKITRDKLLRKADPARSRMGELLEQGSGTSTLHKNDLLLLEKSDLLKIMNV